MHRPRKQKPRHQPGTHSIRDPYPRIRAVLRDDFHCSEEHIMLIIQFLHGNVPVEDLTYLDLVKRGEIASPVPEQGFLLKTEEGRSEEYAFSDHPLTVMLFYLSEKYGRPLGSLLWATLTDIDQPQRYLQFLHEAKQAPIFTTT